MNILDTIKNAFGQGSDDDDFFDSQWEYGQERDAMRDAETVWARLRSDNSVYLHGDTAGEAYLDIIIRKTPDNKISLIFQLSRGKFIGQSGGFFASIKFDRNKIERQHCKTSTHTATNIAFIIQGKEEFIRKLLKSRMLIAEVTIADHGSEQFTFQTVGLDWQSISGYSLRNQFADGSNYLWGKIKRLFRIAAYVSLAIILLSVGMAIFRLRFRTWRHRQYRDNNLRIHGHKPTRDTTTCPQNVLAGAARRSAARGGRSSSVRTTGSAATCNTARACRQTPLGTAGCLPIPQPHPADPPL